MHAMILLYVNTCTSGWVLIVYENSSSRTDLFRSSSISFSCWMILLYVNTCTSGWVLIVYENSSSRTDLFRSSSISFSCWMILIMQYRWVFLKSYCNIIIRVRYPKILEIHNDYFTPFGFGLAVYGELCISRFWPITHSLTGRHHMSRKYMCLLLLVVYIIF